MAKTNYNSLFNSDYFNECFESALLNAKRDFLDPESELTDEDLDSIIKDSFDKESKENLRNDVICAYEDEFGVFISIYGIEAELIWKLTQKLFLRMVQGNIPCYSYIS